MLKPSVYDMSWYTLPFPRTPIRKLTGFKGFYFIKVRDEALSSPKRDFYYNRNRGYITSILKTCKSGRLLTLL